MIVQKNGFWFFGGSVCLRYLELTKVDFRKGRYFHASDPKNVFWPSSLQTCISLKIWVQEIIILKQSQNQSIFRSKQPQKNLFEVFTENCLSDVDEMSIKMASGFSTIFRATHSPVVCPLHVIYKKHVTYNVQCIAKLEL